MASEKEKMLAGDRYDAEDPELVAERERARDLTRRYNRTTAVVTEDVPDGVVVVQGNLRR